MKKLLFLALAALSISCTESKYEGEPMLEPVEYVTTLVGTQSEFALSTGNTYPAIAMPWGMNFWTPQTGTMGDGWAYRYDAKRIRGFKQTHQPSPWINDYGQFSLMPVVGVENYDQDARASWYSHKTETAKPYYYSVYLADHDVVTEITPTDRAAMFQFTFPESEQSAVVVDAFDNGSWVKILEGEQTVVGYTTKNSGGVPSNFKNWFVIRFDRPFTASESWNGETTINGQEYKGEHAGAVVHFNTKRGEKVTARVASSFISLDQAYQNLKELGEDDFATVKSKGEQRWNDVLGRIEVSGGSVDQYRTFYSCLYRSVLFPRKFYEITAEGEVMHYSPYNGEVLPGYMYTDTGFWDTFRSLFPLLNLVYPSVNAEIQEGLANTARESGFLPEWASPGHRGCMIGNNSASVVADAYLKGLVKESDLEALYTAMVHATENVHPEVSSTGRLGHQYYNTLGYVPYDVNIHENVARTLEYAYNDWTILKMAEKLGRPEAELNKWRERSRNYRNVFDESTNLMRGRLEGGDFQTPFSSYKWGDAFTEGNTWHYTWSVFHDVEGLIDLMGGKPEFTQMLDSVFVVPPIYDDSYYGLRIHEITEMQIMNMGNYAHGNQPAQHMIYLYNYASEPWKAQYWTREVMDKLYSATPDGYCGDEDNGQTSAWYVFSSMGFYPVCPGTDEYVIGSPQFKNITINLENGNKIEIDAQNNAKDMRYVNSLKYNGADYQNNFLNYSSLIEGATLDFDMAAEPNKTRGIAPENAPYSLTTELGE